MEGGGGGGEIPPSLLIILCSSLRRLLRFAMCNAAAAVADETLVLRFFEELSKLCLT